MIKTIISIFNKSKYGYKAIFTLITFILLIHYTHAQSKRASKWYFGNNNMLDFTQQPAKLKSEGNTKAPWRAATMCDENGNVQLYTDGKHVWNKYHEIMKNGDSLFNQTIFSGSYSDNVAIVPFIKDKNKFYIFNASDRNSEGNTTSSCYGNDSLFAYSIVDIAANNGNGEVIQKNIKLLSPVSGNVAVVKHGNNRDYWVITQKLNTNEYYAYLVNACGVQAPVISKVGPITETDCNKTNKQLEIKVSPNGKFIDIVLFEKSNILNVSARLNHYLFNFDVFTGKLTENTILPQRFDFYGRSFSANSKYLYIFHYKHIYQYNLESNNIFASIDSIPFIVPSCMFAELAYDGKIYSAPGGLQIGTLCIVSPNEKLTISNVKTIDFKYNVLKDIYGYDWYPEYFSNTTASYLNPEYKEYEFKKPALEFVNRLCKNTEVSFKVNNTNEYSYASWYVQGQGWSQTDNVNKIFKTTFSKAGTYQIKVALNEVCYTDTLVASIKIDNYPSFVFANDSVITCQKPIVLDAGNDYVSYKWQNGTTNQKITASESGFYTVSVSNTCGVATDSIYYNRVQLNMPNIITPNNDGLNETLHIQPQITNPIQLNITNRWGSEVFNSNNYQNNWDANGLSDGIYYYTTNYQGCEAVKGWVQVVR